MTPKQKIKVAKNIYIGTRFNNGCGHHVRITKVALKDAIKYGGAILDNDYFVLIDNPYKGKDLYIN
jgi:hypothetical protein